MSNNTIFSSHTTLDNSILHRFLDLPNGNQGDKIQAEYVWIGGSGQDVRCKTRTLPHKVERIEDLPEWSFDGSSTGQAPGEDSEVILKPRYFCLDPFRGGNNIMVLCENHKPAEGGPIDGNTRAQCQEVHDLVVHLLPWFGIEQEYTLFEADGVTPFGWPRAGFPGPQGPYYCACGTENSYGRHIVEAHYKACLYAGMDISGVNGEVMPGQWEYQVGPAVGVNAADQIWLSRYTLTRVCELFQVIVSLDPKPIPGDWNGAGCHTNFSTEPMRRPGGYTHIIDALEKLKPKHFEHIEIYGAGNERRLTGKHETASITQFSYGVANRGCSCRIPRITEAEGCGYFEDRRPASNMDPYLVCWKLMKTCLL